MLVFCNTRVHLLSSSTSHKHGKIYNILRYSTGYSTANSKLKKKAIISQYERLQFVISETQLKLSSHKFHNCQYLDGY